MFWRKRSDANPGTEYFEENDVVVDGIGQVRVLTSTLSSPHPGGTYETRLSFPKGSEVVERYETAQNAENGHREWRDPIKIRNAWDTYRDLWEGDED